MIARSKACLVVYGSLEARPLDDAQAWIETDPGRFYAFWSGALRERDATVAPAAMRVLGDWRRRYWSVDAELSRRLALVADKDPLRDIGIELAGKNTLLPCAECDKDKPALGEDPSAVFVVTSRTDDHLGKEGFLPAGQYEVYGSMREWQCCKPCRSEVFHWHDPIVVDPSSGRAPQRVPVEEPTPTPHAGGKPRTQLPPWDAKNGGRAGGGQAGNDGVAGASTHEGKHGGLDAGTERVPPPPSLVPRDEALGGTARAQAVLIDVGSPERKPRVKGTRARRRSGGSRKGKAGRTRVGPGSRSPSPSSSSSSSSFSSAASFASARSDNLASDRGRSPDVSTPSTPTPGGASTTPSASAPPGGTRSTLKASAAVLKELRSPERHERVRAAGEPEDSDAPDHSMHREPGPEQQQRLAKYARPAPGTVPAVPISRIPSLEPIAAAAPAADRQNWPVCPACNGPARPNARLGPMDRAWVSNTTGYMNLLRWKLAAEPYCRLEGNKMVILELDVPPNAHTLRGESEALLNDMSKAGCHLIRICADNPSNPSNPLLTVSIAMNARDALRRLDELVCTVDPGESSKKEP